jgi:FRG domain
MTEMLRSVDDILHAAHGLREGNKWRWWFRGHADATWVLLPGVHRDYSEPQERYFTNEFRPRAGMRHASTPSLGDYAGWLALMQHYGLPTRLLDWSRSPLVAAYFATESCQSHRERRPVADACVWAVAPGKLNEMNGLEGLIYPLNAWTLRRYLRPAFVEREEPDEVAAAVPFETDLRMVIQQGCFTVHTKPTPLNEREGSDVWLRRFMIPVDAQPALADDLSALGLRLGDLFPDLANLARELRGDHPPRRGQ